MANVTTAQTLLDGDRNVVIHCVGVLDTSNLSATDVATLSLVPVPTGLRIDKVQYSISSQLSVLVLWDATADVTALALTGQGEFCFKDVGGLINNAGAGVTGKIQLSTVGWASGSQSYTVTLHLVKMGV